MAPWLGMNFRPVLTQDMLWVWFLALVNHTMVANGRLKCTCASFRLPKEWTCMTKSLAGLLLKRQKKKEKRKISLLDLAFRFNWYLPFVGFPIFLIPLQIWVLILYIKSMGQIVLIIFNRRQLKTHILHFFFCGRIFLLLSQ